MLCYYVMYIRKWLSPVNKQLHNITNPHVFVISNNEKKATVLRYKNWSRDLQWFPSKDTKEGVVVIDQVSTEYML